MPWVMTFKLCKSILRVFLAFSLVHSYPAQAAGSAVADQQQPPAIASLVKPSIYKEATSERSVMSHASLEDLPKVIRGPKGEEYPLKRYSFYSTMLVNASLAETHKILTDYPLYPKLVPYIERADFNALTKILTLQGGIWKYVMRSSVRFEEHGERWVHFTIVGGHFYGLEGNIFFERFNEKSTLVYLSGEMTGTNWPPQFIIERGAEVGFTFTGRKMRSYIEDQHKK